MRWRCRNDDGVSSVEYALIAVFVAVVAVTGITALGLLVNGFFSSGGTAVTTVAPDP